jgi:hypothetical protein
MLLRAYDDHSHPRHVMRQMPWNSATAQIFTTQKHKGDVYNGVETLIAKYLTLILFLQHE